MANALVRMGYCVTAICFDKLQGLPGFSLDQEVNFINAYRNGAPIESRGLIRSLRAFSLNRDVRRVKRFNVDCEWKVQNIKRAIAHVPPVDLYIAFQPATTHLLMQIGGMRTPIITMLHFVPSVFLQDNYINLICKSVDLGGILTVLMPSFVSMAREVFPHVDIRVIPNAITEFKYPSRLDENKIVCVARLARQKRVKLLIEAFNLIKDAYPNWVVEFWGEINVEPDYRDEVFDLCKNLRLDDRVKFPGVSTNVEEVLNGSSIFAFPSIFEGFPLALGEAMSKGIPSVGCLDCPGVNELIKTGRNGLLTDPTPQAFSEALASLMENHSLRCRLGTQAREDISKYSPHNVWAQWDALIEELTSN